MFYMFIPKEFKHHENLQDYNELAPHVLNPMLDCYRKWEESQGLDKEDEHNIAIAYKVVVTYMKGYPPIFKALNEVWFNTDKFLSDPLNSGVSPTETMDKILEVVNLIQSVTSEKIRLNVEEIYIFAYFASMSLNYHIPMTHVTEYDLFKY